MPPYPYGGPPARAPWAGSGEAQGAPAQRPQTPQASEGPERQAGQSRPPAQGAPQGPSGAGSAREGDDQPDIIVRQPAPHIIVEQPARKVTVEQQPPEVEIAQPRPEVSVSQPPPRVQVEKGRPDVQVQQRPPEVRVEKGRPEVDVRQAPTRVDVDQPRPDVQVRTPAPRVDVQQAQPDVEVRREPDRAQSERPASGGNAQAPPVRTGPAAADDSRPGREARRLLDMELVTESGKKLGAVRKVARSRQDGRLYVVVPVGGFLGLGEKEVALPVAALESGEAGVLVVRNRTEDAIEELPAYDPTRFDHPGSE